MTEIKNDESKTKLERPRSCRALPYELYRMILDYLRFDELLEAIKASGEASRILSRKVTVKILGEVQKNSEAIAVSQDAWDEYSEKVWETVSRKIASKNTFNEALLDSLVAQLSHKRLHATELHSLSNCRPAISRLKEVSLHPLGYHHLLPFKEIRKLNPSIKWNLVIDYRRLDSINDPEILNVLQGSLKTTVTNQNNLRGLAEICGRCHPSFRLELQIIHAMGNIPLLRDLIGCTSILERLVKLVTTSSTEDHFQSLDTICTICECSNLELALDIGDSCQLLRNCIHVPERLVDLKLRYPTKDDLLWLGNIKRQRELQLQLRSVNSIQTLSDCSMGSRWVLSYLLIERHLRSEEDIFLFKLICKQNPNLYFDMALANASLMRSLLGISSMAMNLSLHGDGVVFCETAFRKGTQVTCELNCLRYFLGLNLSLMTNLQIYCSAGFFLDSTLVETLVTILKQSPNLEISYIHTDEGDQELGEFPALLEQALDVHWKNHETLPRFDTDGCCYAFDITFFA